IAHRNGYYQAN
ncbi:hypothetical protein D030_0637, partial [Vibrio parahaemolyticus AQ3810]